jgi:subtilisin family serine protease
VKSLCFGAFLASLLWGCSALPTAQAARVAGGALGADPERYVVAGVDNREAAPAGHAASSPRGYDGLTMYGPSPRARSLLRGLERDFALREVVAWPIAPLHMHCAVLELPEHSDRAMVLAALSRDPRVRIAQPLQTFTTQTQVYDDPYVGLQRGFQALDVADAHALSRGDGVHIAIIDTGVDTRHPDLRGAIDHTENFVDSDAEQFRRDRHGTELAGIIAAVANNHQGIVGIAPGARLAAFKACWQVQADGDAARCNSFTLARALTAALDAHVDVVNLSLAGPEDPLLRELIAEGQRRGIIFVGAAPAAAAGGGQLMDQDGVIAVASRGPQGAYGSPVHAPGVDILTLLPGGRYDFASGTSLATAHVTGTVALLLARHPRLAATAVYRLLRDSTVTPAGESRVGDPVTADDSIDACLALAALSGPGSCRQSAAAAHRVAMH